MTITDPTITDPTPTTESAAPVAAPARTLGIVALILGIVSIVSGLSAVLGAAAVVVAVLALRQEPASRGIAIAGLATGAVSLAALTVGIGAFFAALPFIGLFGAWGWWW
jgi:hypothetical protein